METAAAPNERALDAIGDEICELAAHLAATTCRWLLLVEEFDTRRGWAEWGVNSCAHWLSWRCGIGLTAAREHVRVARVLAQTPLLRGVFASGELSYSKVRAVTRVVSSETEESLVEMARHATGAQLEKLCGCYGRVVRATREAAQAGYERQELDTAWNDDGTLSIKGRLTAENGAAFLQILESRVPDVEEGIQEYGYTAVRAQALMLAVHGQQAADGQQNAAEVVVHVDAESLREDQVEQRCELDGGPAIAPETARRLACDGGIVRIVERDGRPLSVGRRTRVISPALRRALRSRDGGCRFPGCTHTKYLHAHHIRHWAKGGETEIENLIQLCSHHHRLVHEGGYQVTAADGRVRFRRPDGAMLEEQCQARPARGPGIRAQNASRRLHLNPTTIKPRSAGDRIDYGLAVSCLAWYDDLGGERRALASPGNECF